MNLFDGRLDSQDADVIGDKLYRIVGKYVDNTGSLTARDVSVGDIIYIDGSMLGYTLLRYKVQTINYDEMQRSIISVDAT